MNVPVHELNQQVTDLQWSPDHTYFITASKDKTARLMAARDLEVLKTYTTDTPLNSACLTPKKDYAILGGGQAAMDVTTTAARQGKFEARFYHKIFEDEIGRVRGHFGPLVSLLPSLFLACFPFPFPFVNQPPVIYARPQLLFRNPPLSRPSIPQFSFT